MSRNPNWRGSNSSDHQYNSGQVNSHGDIPAAKGIVPPLNLANYATQQIPTKVGQENAPGTAKTPFVADEKVLTKPPMVLKQEEMFFLGQNNHLKMFFDTRQAKDENAENFDSGRQYLFMSPKEYVYKSWVEIREEQTGHPVEPHMLDPHLKASKVVAHSVSANSNIIIALLQNMSIFIFNQAENTLMSVEGFEFQKTLKGDPTYEISVDADCETIVVLQRQSKQTESIWTWSRVSSKKNAQYHMKTESTPKKAEQRSPSPLKRLSGLFRSNSESGRVQKPNLLSQVFRSPKSKASNNFSGKNQVHAGDVFSKQKTFQSFTVLGSWTNVTISTPNNQPQFNQKLTPLCRTTVVDYRRSEDFPHGMKHAKQNDIVIYSLLLYDKTSYFSEFSKDIAGDLTRPGYKPGSFLQSDAEQDGNAEKILMISKQTICQDLIFKGEQWYPNNMLLTDRKEKMTTLDYIGVFPSESTSQELIARIDTQGNMLAVVANSVHMVYCKVLFVNFATSFIASVNLCSFVKPEDSPPHNARGKTSLVVDDAQWTSNDAFLILAFNNGALALLPRLGSQLLQIVNPTLQNLTRNDTHILEQYTNPRGFNELFVHSEIKQKVQKVVQKRHDYGFEQRFRIAVHPNQDLFLVHDNHAAHVFRMELAPELSKLFSTKNTSFFFMRFCFSMPSLAYDPEILEKVPQLLTNKLPLFEYEKNDEQYDNLATNPAAARVMTCDQINPFQLQERHMETNQSFSADFNEDAEVVLQNLKHLLFTLRWNKSMTLNYLQWLITVVNDCFFFFLKKCEPVYAFHALAIAEFYIKKVLHRSEATSCGQLVKPNSSQGRQGSFPVQKQISCHEDYFVQRAERLMDPILEIYTPLDSWVNNQQKKAKSEIGLSTAQKMTKTNDFLDQFPYQVLQGAGNVQFQFQKNYLLLVLYSLIQFRNYQASNFNIIFLLFANYVNQRNLSSSFVRSMQKIILVIEQNCKTKQKTDDLEMFFGKSGRNKIHSAPGPTHIYEVWTRKVLRNITTYYQQLFLPKVQNLLMTTCLKHYSQTDSEKTLKKFSKLSGNTRGGIGIPLKIVLNLENGQLDKCVQQVREQSDLAETPEGKWTRNPTHNIGISLSILANTLFSQVCLGKEFASSISVSGLLYMLSQLSIKTDKVSPLNCISQHTKTMSSCFQQHGQVITADQVLKQFNLPDKDTASRFITMLFLYLGDVQKAIQVQDQNLFQKPQSKFLEIQLFKMLLLGKTLKKQVEVYQVFKAQLENFNLQNVKDTKMLQASTERLNIGQTLRFVASQIQHTFMTTSKALRNSALLPKAIEKMCILLPSDIVLVVKEEQATECLTLLMLLLSQKQPLSSRKLFDIHSQREKYPLSLEFLAQTLKENFEYFPKAISDTEQIVLKFLQQLETALLCLFDSTENLAYNKTAVNLTHNHVQNFFRLGEVSVFLKTKCSLLNLEKVVQKKASVRGVSDSSKDDNNQVLQEMLSALIDLTYFETQVPAQGFFFKALKIVQHFIQRETSVDAKITESVGLLMNSIRYSELNKVNKMFLHSVFETCKTQKSPLRQSLDQLIFSEKLVQADDMKVLDFKKRVLAYSECIDFSTLPFQTLERDLQRELMCVHKTMFEMASLMQTDLGLSLDTSLFFRGSYFEKRSGGNILGLTNKKVEEFTKAREKAKRKDVDTKRDSIHMLNSGRKSNYGFDVESFKKEKPYKNRRIQFLIGSKQQIPKTSEVPVQDSLPERSQQSEGKRENAMAKISKITIRRNSARRASVNITPNIPKRSLSQKDSQLLPPKPPKNEKKGSVSKGAKLEALFALKSKRVFREYFDIWKNSLNSLRYEKTAFKMMILKTKNDSNKLEQKNTESLSKMNVFQKGAIVLPAKKEAAKPFDLLKIKQLARSKTKASFKVTENVDEGAFTAGQEEKAISKQLQMSILEQLQTKLDQVHHEANKLNSDYFNALGK